MKDFYECGACKEMFESEYEALLCKGCLGK